MEQNKEILNKLSLNIQLMIYDSDNREKHLKKIKNIKNCPEEVKSFIKYLEKAKF